MILVYLFTYEGHGWCIDRVLDSLDELEAPDNPDDLQSLRFSVVVNNSSKEFVKELREKCKARGIHFEDAGAVDENVVCDFKYGDRPLSFKFTSRDMFFVAAAMQNRGIALAERLGADYIYITGGDNIVPPDAIKKQYTELVGNKDVGIVGCLVPVRNTRFKGADGHEWMTPNWYFEHDEARTFAYENYSRLEVMQVDGVGSAGMLIPKKVFTQVKFDVKGCTFGNVYDVKGIETDTSGEGRLKYERKEHYFGSDFKFCVEVKEKLGLMTVVLPQVRVEHLERGQDGKA